MLEIRKDHRAGSAHTDLDNSNILGPSGRDGGLEGFLFACTPGPDIHLFECFVIDVSCQLMECGSRRDLHKFDEDSGRSKFLLVATGILDRSGPCRASLSISAYTGRFTSARDSEISQGIDHGQASIAKFV